MAGVKQIFLLIILQGFYLGSLCQRWTFPRTITALIGSCVEIPCTYHPARTSGTSGTVWYLYTKSSYPEILNTKRSSSVLEEYKGRTSLVPGENSCTLRIHPVREEDGDKYYPGITSNTRTNAYDVNSKTVQLDVTDSLEFINIDVSPIIREGEATSIGCAVDHTCRSSPPSLQWNKPGRVQRKSVDISGGSWREESELTYIPSYVDDGTSVQCTAMYPNGQRTGTSIALNIQYAPKNVTITMTGNKEFMEGSDVTLQCNSFSKPDVDEYEWYKGNNKTKLPFIGWKITVRSVTRDMEPYSCAARNRVGRGESALTPIPVLYAATGVHIIMKNDQEFTELLCDFLSSRPNVTHYTWMKDGSLLQDETEKNLTIYNNEESYGRYSCIAHNRAGQSSSEEIHVNSAASVTRDAVHLPLILGTVAGVFFLVVVIWVVYFYLRKIRKLKHTTTSGRNFSNNMTTNHETLIEENQYGNILTQPDAMRSMSSVDVQIKENYAIYSNSEVMQPTNEVEYSEVVHVQRDHIMSRVSNVDNVEYATVRR